MHVVGRDAVPAGIRRERDLVGSVVARAPAAAGDHSWTTVAARVGGGVEPAALTSARDDVEDRGVSTTDSRSTCALSALTTRSDHDGDGDRVTIAVEEQRSGNREVVLAAATATTAAVVGVVEEPRAHGTACAGADRDALDSHCPGGSEIDGVSGEGSRDSPDGPLVELLA
ncbi:hypothetical protein C1M55_24310 [Rhodococcus qingshengii]|nr:hypothetical protein C1M55_24310 [Rhodococcus qingshengii]